MVWHCLSCAFTIIVFNYIVISFAISDEDEKRLANPELPPQPLTQHIHNPLDAVHTANQEATTSVPDPLEKIHSKRINITTSFPEQPTWRGCIVRISLVGNGINDTYQGRCWIGGAFCINTGGVMMWGHPDKTPVSFYSDKPGTLVVIIDHVCTMKKYKTSNGKSIVSINNMSEDRCNEVVDTIRARMEEFGRSGAPPTIIYGVAVTDGVKDDAFTSSNFESALDGQCQKTVVVKGRGISDSLTVPCTAIKDPQMIQFEGGMLIGNPLKDEVSMFSEEWGTSVVVRGGVCILRRYLVSHGFMKIALSSIPREECEAAKKRMVAKRSAFMDGMKALGEDMKQKLGSMFKLG